MNIEETYKEHNAYLKGHFLLSSGKHSEYYLQSAKVLEQPSVANALIGELAVRIQKANLAIDTICSPALGGLIAGYELARVLGVRFIFTERVQGEMSLRRGFEIRRGENILVCEDIITTGGSALESANVVAGLGANIVGFGALAGRGFCKSVGSNLESTELCKLPVDKPIFTLHDFTFDIYEPTNCPLCDQGTTAIKPGSRNN